MAETHLGFEFQLILVVFFLEPPLLLGEVELLLLEVDDCLLGVVESGKDVIHLSHLLLGPVGLELPKLLYLKISLEVIMIQEFNLYLGIKNTFDSQCRVPFI